MIPKVVPTVAAAGVVFWLGVRNDYAQGWIREIAQHEEAVPAMGGSGYPFHDGWSEQAVTAMGAYLKEYYPDTVFMARFPKETR